MFTDKIHVMRKSGSWNRSELIGLFNQMIPEFNHMEKGKFLDGKM
jgi:hypothetical protein